MGCLNRGRFDSFHSPVALRSGFCFLRRASAGSQEVSAIAAQEPRLNREITTRECRLIGYDGSQMGIYATVQALRIAESEGYDLVEIAPNAEPPVCRIMDYGKFKYDQAIKAKQARKNQSRIETTEMKFRPKIDVGDYTTIESAPKMEGRNMHMLIAPLPSAVKKKKEAKAGKNDKVAESDSTEGKDE